MTRQRSTKQAANSGPDQSRKKQSRRLTLFGAAASLLLLALALFAAYRRAETRRASSEARKAHEHSVRATPTPQLSERALKDTVWDPAWPPLPDVGTPAKPIEHVRAMYAFAARHPEVMQYAPCYCGCERSGHRSASDCFVKGRDASGRPQWDGRGFT
jgi:hypothetical protein